MFDIGFSEMMVIAVVALIVIGPEKLPRVARNVGAYLGRLQRYVNDVKADINREIELDELRKFKQQVEETATSFESSVRDEMNKTETDLNKVAQDAADTTPSTSLASDGVGSAPAVEHAGASASSGTQTIAPEPVAPVAPPASAPASPPTVDAASAKRAA